MADPSASSLFFYCGASMEGVGADVEDGELGAVAAGGVRGSGGRAGHLGGATAMVAAVGGGAARAERRTTGRWQRINPSEGWSSPVSQCRLRPLPSPADAMICAILSPICLHLRAPIPGRRHDLRNMQGKHECRRGRQIVQIRAAGPVPSRLGKPRGSGDGDGLGFRGRKP
jgi:hypothetical protein